MKKIILDFLEETCEKYPHRIAFSDLYSSITFSELLFRSKVVGTVLARYTQSGNVIPFYLDKGVNAIIGFMGAVYAGCAYSQVNLRYPSERIRLIFETVQPNVVITDQEHKEIILKISNCTVIAIEDIMEGVIDEDILNSRRSKLMDVMPLYVNFTSGSTGTPKGVVVSHRNVVDFVDVFTNCFSIDKDDIIANQAPFDFDVSVKDIYSCIFTGARVEIVPTDYFMKPKLLGDFLAERKVTIMIWAVSALCFLTTMKVFDYRKPDTIRMIMFSGEVMPVKHLKKLQTAFKNVVYVNLYGPTEITCNCTYYVVDREFEEGDSLPIGIPFPNRKVFLLDEYGKEVTEPNGIGELCVGGSSVALGYYGNQAKTNECFCQNPLNDLWDERIYRTGDLVKITDNGEMVYVTRRDFQIKHMGHRIELTEIDTALQAIPEIDRACCIYDSDKKRIIAFVVGTLAQSDIRSTLKTKLPDYMIPNVFCYVSTMPLNKNGKIDRNVLMDIYHNQ